jgi:hypothetical protein
VQEELAEEEEEAVGAIGVGEEVNFWIYLF